jgi:DeoR family glycerol-3-phosphate regulon repressor
MHKTARQKYLLDIISEHGQVSISDLVEKLQVSADTVRRDLTDLENQGLAQKNHGGAIALDLSAMNRQGRNTLLPKPSSSLVKRSQRACPQAQPCFLMREVR